MVINRINHGASTHPEKNTLAWAVLGTRETRRVPEANTPVVRRRHQATQTKRATLGGFLSVKIVTMYLQGTIVMIYSLFFHYMFLLIELFVVCHCLEVAASIMRSSFKRLAGLTYLATYARYLHVTSTR